MNQFWGIWYEMLEFAINGVYSEDSILSDVGMTMFKTCAAGGNEGFKKLHVFGYLLKESKRSPPDIFVWMLL